MEDLSAGDPLRAEQAAPHRHPVERPAV